MTLNFTSTDPANADPSQPHAGVDYIEHRVTLNGVPGAWVRTTNPGLVNPFTSSVTVTELGAYTIEYRSVDRGGNAEAIKSVTFWINRPTTTTAPAGKVSAIVPSTLGADRQRAGARPVHPGRGADVHRHDDRDGHVVVAERHAVGLRRHEHEHRPAGQRLGRDSVRPAVRVTPAGRSRT